MRVYVYAPCRFLHAQVCCTSGPRASSPSPSPHRSSTIDLPSPISLLFCFLSFVFPSGSLFTSNARGVVCRHRKQPSPLSFLLLSLASRVPSLLRVLRHVWSVWVALPWHVPRCGRGWPALSGKGGTRTETTTATTRKRRLTAHENGGGLPLLSLVILSLPLCPLSLYPSIQLFSPFFRFPFLQRSSDDDDDDDGVV